MDSTSINLRIAAQLTAVALIISMRGEKCCEEEGAESSPVTEATTSKELLEQQMASVALPSSDAPVPPKISPKFPYCSHRLCRLPTPLIIVKFAKKDFERIPTKEYKVYPFVTRRHIIIFFHVSHGRRLESSPLLEIQCQPPPRCSARALIVARSSLDACKKIH